MDLLLDFSDLLANNEYFRSGFLWGLSFVALGSLGWWLLQGIYKQWLKVRQFFEPIKKPGKLPIETGPSPAGMSLGCLGRVLAFLLIPVLCYYLLWLWQLQGG